MRAALQIIPQATNRRALGRPKGTGGEIRSSTVQMATATPPNRYALPHHAKARMHSCAETERRKRPSRPAMLVPTRMRVLKSRSSGPGDEASIMTYPLQQSCCESAYHDF